MDTFKMWILSLCGATAITSLFRILLSKSSLNKVLNIFFTLFVLFYTIIPIRSAFGDFDTAVNAHSVETDYDDVYKSGYEEIIKSSVDEVCKNSGVTVYSFDVTSYIGDDNYLYVEKIEIDIDDDGKTEKIRTELKEKFGYEVIVK